MGLVNNVFYDRKEDITYVIRRPSRMTRAQIVQELRLILPQIPPKMRPKRHTTMILDPTIGTLHVRTGR